MEGEFKNLFLDTERFLSELPLQLPEPPKALLVVSAHWEADRPRFTGQERPGLIYDYYGFPEHTYHLTYPASGAPALAHLAAQCLSQAGFDAVVDDERGWDHGVFIPLKVMYPEAQLPVVAMSLHHDLDPQRHHDWGQALRPLRDQGVLIVGSGMSYHNLRQFQQGGADSESFHQWLQAALNQDHAHRAQALAQWAQAPGGRSSHPREEHLLPLMVASGAGSDQPGRCIWTGRVANTTLGAWAFD
jgi:aromatic ring-opening dioxygenase catalytic subunit (LigB family)